MPFDGSGNFTRQYSWQSDRDNGIRILASRMDGEFDNFAAAMNVVFFRNGLVPMTGPLNMAGNPLFGVASGSAGAMGIRFADDPNSGLFLAGIGRPTIGVGGVSRVEANSTGAIVNGLLTINGGLNVSGMITQAGQAVWTAGNFDPGAYMPKSGGAFTGEISVPAVHTRTGGNVSWFDANNLTNTRWYAVNSDGVFNILAGDGVARFSLFNNRASFLQRVSADGFDTAGTMTAASITVPGGVFIDTYAYMNRPTSDLVDISADVNDFVRYTRSANKWDWILGAFSSATLSADSFLHTNTIRAGVAMTVAGQEVFHRGNLNPATFQPAGDYAVRGDGTGVIFLGNTGRYVYWDGANYLMPGGPLRVNDSQVWTAATLNPASFQPAGNYAVRGADNGFRDVAVNRGNNTGLLAFGDGNTYISFNGTQFEFTIGAQKVASISAGSARFRGDVFTNLGDAV